MGPRLQDFREVARTCRLSGPVPLGGCRARDVHVCPGALSNCVSKATPRTKTSLYRVASFLSGFRPPGMEHILPPDWWGWSPKSCKNVGSFEMGFEECIGVLYQLARRVWPFR